MNPPQADLRRNQDNIDAYERIADTYAGDDLTEDDPALRARWRAAFVERLAGPWVLEIGCGPGTDARRLMDAGLQVTATDACARFVTIARTRHPGLDVRVMDVLSADLPEQGFDGILAFGVLVHLPRSLTASALASMHGLLAPGGVVLLALIGSGRVAEYSLDDWGGLTGNQVLFTCHSQDEIRDLLEGAGFAAVEILDPGPSIYDHLERLVTRGVRAYWVAARRPALPEATTSRSFTLP